MQKLSFTPEVGIANFAEGVQIPGSTENIISLWIVSFSKTLSKFRNNPRLNSKHQDST